MQNSSKETKWPQYKCKITAKRLNNHEAGGPLTCLGPRSHDLERGEYFPQVQVLFPYVISIKKKLRKAKFSNTSSWCSRIRALTVDPACSCEAACKRGHQRPSRLRKLFRFHIDKAMMILFYRTFTESVVSYSLVSWFGNFSLKNRIFP